MVFSSIKGVALVASAILFSATSAAPTAFTSNLETMRSVLEKRAATTVTGVQSGFGPATGQVPTRRDFNDFANDAASTNLYLLALEQLQSTTQSNPLSFYQLAGIHGRPYLAWEDVATGNDNGGYCTHVDSLFAIWHRPYLALYEQALWTAVQSLAKQFPAGSAEQNVAASWRMPYWDWAHNATVPALISSPQVSVTRASNGQTTVTTIPNPLAGYTFNNLKNQAGDFPDAPFKGMKRTLRNPTNGVSNVADLNAKLQNIGTNLKQRTYNILTQIKTYNSFSSKAASTDGSDSLEGVHDTIHAVVGGDGGNMAWVDYAAFDPIFFLHHTNIDRLFAIWQAINPTVANAISGNSPQGTFGIPQNAPENANTGLSPFYKQGTTFWTPGTAPDTNTFGYAYPELPLWNLGGQTLQNVAIAAVNNLYGTGAPAGMLSTASSAAASSTTTSKSSSTTTKPATTTKPPTTTSTTPKPTMTSTIKAASTTTIPPAVIPTITPKPTTAPSTKITTALSTSTPVPVVSSPVPSAPATQAQHCDWWCQLENWWNTEMQNRRFHHNNKKRGLITDIVNSVVNDVDNIVAEVSHDLSSLVDAIPSPETLVLHAHKLVKDGGYNDYLANIQVLSSALRGTFGVYFFLGDVPADASTWDTSEKLIGTYYAFTAIGGGHSTVISGTVPLTGFLINQVTAGGLESLDSADVYTYLGKNLHWGVKQACGTVTPNDQVSGLEVQVLSAQVKLSPPGCDVELPTYGKYSAKAL